MEKLSLKFDYPNVVMTISDSFSGKSLRHKLFLRQFEKFFGDPTQYRHLYIVTDKDSLGFWETVTHPEYLKKTILTFDDLEKFQPESRTVFIFDDLMFRNYKKCASILESLTSVFCHHGESVLFLIIQNLVDDMRHLLSRITELHLNARNNSCLRMVNYLCQYYFPKSEKPLILKALSSARHNIQDVYLVLRFKNYYESPVLINKVAFISGETDLPCWTILSSEKPDYLSCDDYGNWYLKQENESLRVNLKLALSEWNMTTSNSDQYFFDP